jgi:hypothetical protein
MHGFDEAILVAELATIPAGRQLAFAAAAAIRQLESYEWYARRLCPDAIARPREIAMMLWDESPGERHDWAECLAEVLGLMPEESDEWTVFHSLAEDALASLAYAIRALLTADPQEAAWAARRGYEAVDQAAIRLMGIHPGPQEAEQAILKHALVQQELGRQRRDLLLIATDPRLDALTALRDQALTEPSVSIADLELLACREPPL